MTTAVRTTPALPHRLQVEVTATCNLACRMCIVRYSPKQPRSASMGFDAFRALVDGMPDLREVVLQGIGEPLMAPDIYRMIAYASERGIATEFNTNATLLTHAAGRKLIEAGLSVMHVSMDGATPGTYEFVRDGANWATVERNITRFVELRRELAALHPTLSLVMVLMRQTLGEIANVVRRAAEWDIPEVFVQNLSHDFSDAPADAYAAIAAFVRDQSVSSLPRAEVERSFEEARRVARDCGTTLRLPQLDGREAALSLPDGTPVACDWPWQGGYVSQAGDVLPCCMVMGGADRISFGNVHERSFAEIWSDEAFRAFREGLVNGDPHPVCRGCSLYQGTF